MEKNHIKISFSEFINENYNDKFNISHFFRKIKDEFGDEYVEKLKVHLINNTNQAYEFEYELKFFKEAEFDLKNNLQPFENFYIHDVLFEDMNDSPSFDFVFSFKFIAFLMKRTYNAIIII